MHRHHLRKRRIPSLPNLQSRGIRCDPRQMNKRVRVCIVTTRVVVFKYHVMNALPIFAMIVIGVMNFKPIMKFASAIDAMDFIAKDVMKWINAMIVEKSSVEDALRYCRVNFAEEDCVRIVPRRVENVALSCVRGIPNLQSNAILAN